MEKQNWQNPEIEALNVTETEWTVDDGKKADGYYDSDPSTQKCWPLFDKS